MPLAELPLWGRAPLGRQIVALCCELAGRLAHFVQGVLAVSVTNS